jgi:hypothetical protein
LAVLEPFAFDYAQLVAVSALGVIQFAAARNRLYGLMFLRHWPRLTEVLSAAALIAAFLWFFVWSGPRNVPDTGVGLEANTQTGVFAFAAAAAIMFTFVGSSIVNHRWGRGHGWDPNGVTLPPAGFGWFERTTFARALMARLRVIARRAR